MQFISFLTVALSVFSTTSASIIPFRMAADNPALTWHISDFDIGCSPGGCTYRFGILGVGTANTPGFNTTCSGITSSNSTGLSTTCSGGTAEEKYTECKDKGVVAVVNLRPYPTWNIEVEHSWYRGVDNNEHYTAYGQANVTSTMQEFTIPFGEFGSLGPIGKGGRGNAAIETVLGMETRLARNSSTASRFRKGITPPDGRTRALGYVMASILRQIVAGPRLPHPEAGLDLCYVTDKVIATSGPSSNYPQRAYRTPVKDLVNFLDSKHGSNWCIWEFRAEGTGYPDSEVYGRIHHFPFPDHHPPPFAIIPGLMASMRNWVHRLDNIASSKADLSSDVDKNDPNRQEGGEENQGLNAGSDDGQQGKRVAVVHCKAGKGRSGTIACSYLISQEGWAMEDALRRFTERRMRVGFGSGVSIPSQLRWVRYVDQWTNQLGKKYVERPVEILELHVWGLRDGVKVAVEGFVDEGRKIKCFHQFTREERIIMGADNGNPTGNNNSPLNNNPVNNESNNNGNAAGQTSTNTSPLEQPLSAESQTSTSTNNTPLPSSIGLAVLLQPQTPIVLPTGDVNIDFERKSKAAYTGFAMVTSIAHVWFNPYFEGGDKYDSGVFEIDWEALDGIKGTTKKGIKALDKLKVVWRYQSPRDHGPQGSLLSGLITEPKPGEPIHEGRPADWRLQAQDPEREGDGEEQTDDKIRDKDQENIPIRTMEVPAHRENSGLVLAETRQQKVDESLESSSAGGIDPSKTIQHPPLG